METIARTMDVYQKSWQRPQNLKKTREIRATSVLDGLGTHSKPINRSIDIHCVLKKKTFDETPMFTSYFFINVQSYVTDAAEFVLLSTVFVFYHFFGMEEIPIKFHF